MRQAVEVEMEIPDQIDGQTQERDGHTHKFVVKIDDNGKMSGETDVVNGHKHRITRSTVTDKESGHDHRFSFMEALINE